VKLYFAGDANDERLAMCGVRHVLVSYANGTKASSKRIEFFQSGDIFLDSGAFSAFRQYRTIDLGEYISFIKTVQPNVFAALDVIERPEETFGNYRAMKAEGLEPLPVYHTNSNEKWLRGYLEAEPYVALGGMAREVRARRIKWLDWCWSIIGEYWPVKIHGFGVTDRKLLERYPWYSVDSASWLYGCSQAMLMTEASEYVKLSREHLRDPRRLNEKKQARVLRDRNLVVAATGDWKERVMHNIKGLLAVEREVTDLWTRRGVVWQ
jgi:hypothetical protein